MKLLDPKHDVVFKMLFGAEQNRDILISFLNAVLRSPAPIVSVRVLSDTPERHDVNDKAIVLDLRIELETGEQIDVEMQSQPRPAERQRALFYWAKLYAAQLQRGAAYTALRRCVVIIIANFRMLTSPRFHSTFSVRAEATDEILTRDLEMHFIELPKLERSAGNEERQLVAWGKFLTAETDTELEQLKMHDPAVKRAMEALEVLSADPRARMIAEQLETRELADRMQFQAGMREAQAQGLAQGVAQGLAQGVAQGLAQGVAQGVARGRAEGKAEAVLTLLSGRAVQVDDAARERIWASTDAQLNQILLKAISVQNADELFDS